MESFTAIDELRIIRNYYYTGMFQRVVEEATPLVSTVPFAAEYRLRALAEINPAAVDAEINDSSPFPLQMIKLMCLYKAADVAQKPNMLAVLDEWISIEAVNSSEVSQVIAAIIYIASGQMDKAWRWVTATPASGTEMNLEKLSLQVFILLHQKRVDLAQKCVARMKEIDDDEVLTTLTNAWVLETKLTPTAFHEALALYLEVSECVGPCEFVFNQIGACYAALGLYKNAFQALKRARDIVKAANPSGVCSREVLRNTLCVMFQRPGGASAENEQVLSKIQAELEQSEYVQQIPTDLSTNTVGHYGSDYKRLSDAFDQAAANYV